MNFRRRIDDVIIDVAAEGSTGEPPAGPPPEDMKQWLKGLSTDEKESYLLLFLTEEGALPARAEMLRRFREQAASKGSRPMPKIARRKVAKLLADRDALVIARDRKAAERAAKEKIRKAEAEAEARSKYLDELANREVQAWAKVDALIAKKLPKDYDEAVVLLVDLRDLAGRSGWLSKADARLRELRQQHAKKPAFVKRLDDKKLGI